MYSCLAGIHIRIDPHRMAGSIFLAIRRPSNCATATTAGTTNSYLLVFYVSSTACMLMK